MLRVSVELPCHGQEEAVCIKNSRASYMAMRRAFERDGRVQVTQAMVEAYNGSSKQRNRLLCQLVQHQNDLEKISIDIMKDCLVCCMINSCLLLLDPVCLM